MDMSYTFLRTIIPSIGVCEQPQRTKFSQRDGQVPEFLCLLLDELLNCRPSLLNRKPLPKNPLPFPFGFSSRKAHEEHSIGQVQ
jgi:hypothetical protein